MQIVQRRHVRHPAIQVAIGLDGEQFASRGQPANRLAQVFPGHALDLVGMGNQIVERAIFLQPLGRSLRPDFGHSGHVVHHIAHQCLVVHHQAGWHPKFGLNPGQIPTLAIHGVNDGDVLVHQLRQILVATGHDHLDALGRGGIGQCANHVIGLNPRYIQHLPAKQSHQLVNRLNLRPQIVGHGAAVLLVFGVNFIPKSRAFGIKHASRINRWHILAQALHHVDHAANGPRSRAGGVTRHGPQVGHGMKSPVKVTGPIHQQQSGFGAGNGGGRFRFRIAHAPIVHGREASNPAGLAAPLQSVRLRLQPVLKPIAPTRSFHTWRYSPKLPKLRPMT